MLFTDRLLQTQVFRRFVQDKILFSEEVRFAIQLFTGQVGTEFAVNMIIRERGSWMGLKSVLDSLVLKFY